MFALQNKPAGDVQFWSAGLRRAVGLLRRPPPEAWIHASACKQGLPLKKSDIRFCANRYMGSTNSYSRSGRVTAQRLEARREESAAWDRKYGPHYRNGTVPKGWDMTAADEVEDEDEDEQGATVQVGGDGGGIGVAGLRWRANGPMCTSRLCVALPGSTTGAHETSPPPPQPPCLQTGANAGRVDRENASPNQQRQDDDNGEQAVRIAVLRLPTLAPAPLLSPPLVLLQRTRKPSKQQQLPQRVIERPTEAAVAEAFAAAAAANPGMRAAMQLRAQVMAEQAARPPAVHPDDDPELAPAPEVSGVRLSLGGCTLLCALRRADHLPPLAPTPSQVPNTFSVPLSAAAKEAMERRRKKEESAKAKSAKEGANKKAPAAKKKAAKPAAAKKKAVKTDADKEAAQAGVTSKKRAAANVPGRLGGKLNGH